ncbi:MAG: pectate lyase [Terracidiphilus sp.]
MSLIGAKPQLMLSRARDAALRAALGMAAPALGLLLFAWSPLGFCAVVGRNLPAQSLTRARIQTLPRGQRRLWLEYLERSERQRREDKLVLQRELQRIGARAPRIPREGASARSIPMNRPQSWYGGADARQIAETIVSFQTPAGGWGKNLDMRQGPRQEGEAFVPNNLSRFTAPDDFDTPREPDWNYVGTIDNDATTTELRFLARVISATGAKKSAEFRTAFLRGMRYLLRAQFPNGGWPQVWPLEGGYHDAITYNDDAMIEVMQLMGEVAGGRQEFSFVPAQICKQADKSFQHGMRCVLATQIVSGGRLTVWPQQDDPLTLKPVSGRNFEPAAECAGESTDVALLLMNGLPEPTPGEVRAIRGAAEWFTRTAIYGERWTRTGEGRELVPQPGAGPVWARFYAVGSDQPIFSDRNKLLYDRVEDISTERRNGYQWYVQKPAAALERYKTWSALHPAAM